MTALHRGRGLRAVGRVLRAVFPAMAVEAGLHPVEHVLILPAFDDPPRGRGAPGSERTGDAGAQVAVAVEVFRVIRAAMDFGEFCARRTGVVVALGVVDEVLPGEQAA